LNREHGDVVFLPELLRGKRDCFGGLVADGGGPVETEEFFRGGVGGFQDPIGEQG